MCRARFVLQIIQRCEKLYFVADLVGGNGVGEGGCRLDVHICRLGHHTAKQGNIQGIHCWRQGLLGHPGQIFVLDLAVIKSLFLCVGGEGLGFGVADKQQGVVTQLFGNSLATGCCLRLAGTSLLAGTGKDLLGFLGADTEFHTQIVHGQPHLTLPALGANTGAGDSADNGSFGGAHIIAIQAGDGERLQNVKLDPGVAIAIVHGEVPSQAKGLSITGTICNRPQPYARARPMPWVKLVLNCFWSLTCSKPWMCAWPMVTGRWCLSINCSTSIRSTCSCGRSMANPQLLAARSVNQSAIASRPRTAISLRDALSRRVGLTMTLKR